MQSRTHMCVQGVCVCVCLREIDVRERKTEGGRGWVKTVMEVDKKRQRGRKNKVKKVEEPGKNREQGRGGDWGRMEQREKKKRWRKNRISIEE